jgi:enoyl-CoA hydratase
MREAFSRAIYPYGGGMAYENILVETRGRVGLITLNRPKALNALNDALMDELGAALREFDADEAIGAIVVTGNEKAFAAGADIGVMASFTYMDVYKGDYITRNWEAVRSIRKPIIAAVAGFALGGGCELAMMCDIIFAADTAKFGQPEIKLGIESEGDGPMSDCPLHGCRRSRARRTRLARNFSSIAA